MPEYDNNNSGVLFKNDGKTTANQPDYKGQAEVDGEEYWLSAWIKQGKTGKFMSLAFTPRRSQTDTPPQTDLGNFDSDDIPF